MVATTVALYLLCGYWIWDRRALLGESVKFPLAVLWLPVCAGVLITALKPWRHRWLLERYGISTSWLAALKDRLVMTTLKVFGPWVIGDPYGYLVVGRRLDLDLRQLTPLWLVDKWLTLASVLLLGWMAAIWWLSSLWIAVSGGGVLLLALLLWGGPWMRPYPPDRRRRLILVALAQEGLHLAGFAVLLAAVLDGGWTQLQGHEVMMVHLAGMLPTLLGGAG